MLKAEGVDKSYRVGGMFAGSKRQVLHDVSFECARGECLGIIGESGSGKSTLGRLLLGIEKPDRGTVTLKGRNVMDRRTRAGALSAVFQNYRSSLNPYFTVEQAIMEPMKAARLARDGMEEKIGELLQLVGLPAGYRSKYPHELSGGEAQRVCIARAISTEPGCILLDEAVSSLDVSVQAQVLELLRSLKERGRTSYIFITHDVQAAAYLCDRIMIFRDGRIEETLETSKLGSVRSAYARKLLASSITI
ncbi:ABC transporter ATP-binding protein [Paenibacillus soyae]|uniref:ABC transporter ATP-binding protein n=1 Tax=Paenibacillus soyae TaxID=2969249 RepID=A0A9X2MU83_9BACL|nr:ABC transporter ATP-binding protein [Paenibacillus soyae]MCR2806580.1 ABC transporter ATP-binding protein [Paenibacillus soyae]